MARDTRRGRALAAAGVAALLLGGCGGASEGGAERTEGDPGNAPGQAQAAQVPDQPGVLAADADIYYTGGYTAGSDLDSDYTEVTCKGVSGFVVRETGDDAPRTLEVRDDGTAVLSQKAETPSGTTSTTPEQRADLQGTVQVNGNVRAAQLQGSTLVWKDEYDRTNTDLRLPNVTVQCGVTRPPSGSASPS